MNPRGKKRGKNRPVSLHVGGCKKLGKTNKAKIGVQEGRPLWFPTPGKSFKKAKNDGLLELWGWTKKTHNHKKQHNRGKMDHCGKCGDIRKRDGQAPPGGAQPNEK